MIKKEYGDNTRWSGSRATDESISESGYGCSFYVISQDDEHQICITIENDGHSYEIQGTQWLNPTGGKNT